MPNAKVLSSNPDSSPTAPPVRPAEQRQDNAAQLLLVRAVGPWQRRGGGPEPGEPVHLVQHRQPGERHYVPHQGEAQAASHRLICSSLKFNLFTLMSSSGRHCGSGASQREDGRDCDGGRPHRLLHSGRRPHRVWHRRRRWRLRPVRFSVIQVVLV